MEKITKFEKSMDTNRKLLLFALIESEWEIENFENDLSDWDVDQEWHIKSTKRNKGFSLWLVFYKYNGTYDGMNRVVAELKPGIYSNTYGGSPSLEFNGNKFSENLKMFVAELNNLRINGDPKL
jgi:hypothetical protein